MPKSVLSFFLSGYHNPTVIRRRWFKIPKVYHTCVTNKLGVVFTGSMMPTVRLFVIFPFKLP